MRIVQLFVALIVGALVGVVATILGTVWLKHYRSSAQEMRQRRDLMASLSEMQLALTAVSKERGEDAIAQARAAKVLAEEGLLRAFDKFVFARHFVPRQDVNSWYAIEMLQAAIVREREMLEKELRDIKDAGDNEAVFAVNISKVSQAAQKIELLLAAAKKEVSRPLGLSLKA